LKKVPRFNCHWPRGSDSITHWFKL